MFFWLDSFSCLPQFPLASLLVVQKQVVVQSLMRLLLFIRAWVLQLADTNPIQPTTGLTLILFAFHLEPRIGIVPLSLLGIFEDGEICDNEFSAILNE
jgi:hypothetical protein